MPFTTMPFTTRVAAHADTEHRCWACWQSSRAWPRWRSPNWDWTGSQETDPALSPPRAIPVLYDTFVL
jgi:hypothetical protein